MAVEALLLKHGQDLLLEEVRTGSLPPPLRRMASDPSACSEAMLEPVWELAPVKESEARVA
ncbi:MAG TPA: hypothetical protein DDZ88_02905 [Verrucomicrobiales bacterium]|nr:hypothetical protein [Verrucomicrobiales bacterium]